MTAVIAGRQLVDGQTPALVDHEADLADVTGLSLAELLATDNPVLIHSLSRVIIEDDEAQGIVAGFQSAI